MVESLECVLCRLMTQLKNILFRFSPESNLCKYVSRTSSASLVLSLEYRICIIEKNSCHVFTLDLTSTVVSTVCGLNIVQVNLRLGMSF